MDARGEIPAILGSAHAARTCADCACTSVDRQYARLIERVTCEPCLLDQRKRAAGLPPDPNEMLVESLAAALDLRERETGLHSKRVAAETLILARHFYRGTDDLREIYWGSLLHDIGKIGVPDSILLKPGPLTNEEWKIMQKHPENGFRILEGIPFLALASRIVLCHEERYDGSGYPAGLKGENIPLPARLFAVIDTLDAMIFDRPYRQGLPFDVAKAEIVRMASVQFDPLAVETFLREENALRDVASLRFP